MSTQQEYFDKALNWDANERENEKRTKNIAVKIAIAASVLVTLETVAICIGLPLKSVEQVIIRVDRLTGKYDVQVGQEKFDVDNRENENIIRGDLSNYVIHREGFTRAEAENNYRHVYWNSCGDVRESWNAYIIPEKNKMSPITVYGLSDADRVKIDNISFLPTDKKELRTAQVRFELSKIKPNTPTVKSKYIATILYRYSPENIPTDVSSLHYNPLGFCALSYRKDQEGQSEIEPVISSAGSK